MTWLDAHGSQEWVGYLASLFPLVAAGFLVGCAVWLVAFVIHSIFRALRGR